MTVSIEQIIPYLCFLFGAIPLAWCGINISQPRALRYGLRRWSQILFKTESLEDFFARKDFEETEKNYQYVLKRLKQLEKSKTRAIAEEAKLLNLVLLLQKHLDSVDDHFEEVILDTAKKQWFQSKMEKLSQANLNLMKVQRQKVRLLDEEMICTDSLVELRRKREILKFSPKIPEGYQRLDRHDRFVSYSARIQRSEMLVIANEMKAFGVCEKAEGNDVSTFQTVESLTILSTMFLNFDELSELFDTAELVLEDCTYKAIITKESQATLAEILEEREAQLKKATALLEEIEIEDDVEERNIYRFINELIDEIKQCRIYEIQLHEYLTVLNDMMYRLMLKQREIAVRIVDLKNKEKVAATQV